MKGHGGGRSQTLIIYEKNAIIDLYNKNGTSPYTREPLHKIFIEQSQLQEEIDSFIN